MNFLDKYSKKETINSLEILREINFFREKEGNRAELQHKTLLEIIRDEFDEEINEQKILPVTYKDKKGEDRPMFELTTLQVRQILLRESKFVRRAVIHYIEKLENEVQELRLKEYQRMLEDNQKMMIENKSIKEENEDLKYQVGNGKYLKAIPNIEWLKKYFYIDKTGFVLRLTKELILLSHERRIPYDGIIPPFSNKEILVFHTDIYRAFRELLDKDEELKIMPSYRRII